MNKLFLVGILILSISIAACSSVETTKTIPAESSTATIKYTFSPTIQKTATIAAAPTGTATPSITPPIIEKTELHKLALNEKNVNRIKNLVTFDISGESCLISPIVDTTLETRLVNGQIEYLLASRGTERQNIQIWNLETQKNIQTLSNFYAESILFHPDRKTLVSFSGSDQGTVTLWDIQSGKQKQQFVLPAHHFYDGRMSIRQDGSTIALFSIPYNSENFHLSELILQNAQIRDADYDFPLVTDLTLQPHMYSPKGNLIAVTYGRDNHLHLIDLTHLKDTILQFPFHSIAEVSSEDAAILTITIDSTETYLAGGSIHGDIYIWNFADGTLVKSFKAHNTKATDGWRGGVKILAFAPASTLLLSVGYADVTKLWNPITGRLLKETGSCDYFGGFTQDGRYLVTIGKNGVETWGIP